MLSTETLYISKDWKKIKTSIDYSKDNYRYIQALMSILDIKFDSEDIDKELSSHKLIYWLTNDLVFPSWVWHSETWKCIWLNTWWVTGDKYLKILESFDIKN